MSNTKVSAFTLAIAAQISDLAEYPLNAGGLSRKATGTLLKNYFGNQKRNVNITSQTPAAATRTYIAGTAITAGIAGTWPSNGTRVSSVGSNGTFFQWRFNMTKTAFGSATSTIDIAMGTAGTTADAAAVSFTKPAGTAAADEAWCTVDLFITAAGAGQRAEFTMLHASNTAGHATIPVVVVRATGAASNTVDSTIFGLCITTGAADVITIDMVSAQAFNL